MAGKRFAGLSRRDVQPVVRSFSAQGCEIRIGAGPLDSDFPFRLSEGAASGGKSAGQRAETHAPRWNRNAPGETALLGTTGRSSFAAGGKTEIPFVAAELRGS